LPPGGRVPLGPTPSAGGGRRRRRGGAGFDELIAQARRAIEAGRRLAQAHLALLRAELGEIAGEIGTIVAQAGAILAIAIFAALLLTIGTTLFLGEWLFGSMGWGVLHGVLLSVALIVTIALVIVEAPGRFHAYGLLAGLGTGLVTLLILGTNSLRKLAESAGQALLDRGASLDPAWAPVIAAMGLTAIILGVVLLIVGWRVGAGRGGIYGLVGGLILGLPLGASSAAWRGASTGPVPPPTAVERGSRQRYCFHATARRLAHQRRCRVGLLMFRLLVPCYFLVVFVSGFAGLS